MNLETSVESPKSAQALGAPRTKKCKTTNQVAQHFLVSLITPIAYTALWRSTEVSRMNDFATFSARSHQSGVALIVSLILLAVITMMGVAGMQMATQEFKMATSSQDRATAFAAAEAALVSVERNLAISPPDRDRLLTSCTGTGCYNATCNGGFCFDGAYSFADTEWDCKVANAADTAERVDFWSDSTLNIWNTSTKYKTMTIERLDTDVKYIIEFLCYVQRDSTTVFSGNSATEKNNGAPLFRITALAEGNGRKGRVMLQSTYKVLAGQ